MRQLLPALAMMWMSACSNETSTFTDGGASQSDGAVPDLSQPPESPLPDLTAAVPDLAVAVDPPDLSVEAPVDLALGPTADLAHDPAGPWPTSDLVIHAGAGDLIDASPDDAQNIWAVSPEALYLLKPGSSAFVKFTAADGLHIRPFIGPLGNPDETRITAVAGGAANQVFVGYHGYESDNRLNDTVANMQLGQADKVTLGSDGKISVLKYDFRCDYANSWCWENRSARRMTFVHAGAAAGHLFIGFDHGVTHVFNDTFGDHIHVETHWHYPDGHVVQVQGEQYGLFPMPNGDLWTASGVGVGLMPWNPQPHFAWVDGSFKEAFTLFTSDHGLDTASDYRENNRGVAVTSDGNVWFATLQHGLVSWNMGTPHNYAGTRAWPSVPTNLMDLAADPDGTLWIVTTDGQLLRFTPATNRYVVWPGVSDVRRIVMDTTVIPRALYVSMGSGLAVIRAR